MPTHNRLFIVGDSFSAVLRRSDPFVNWFGQTAHLLGMGLENYSMIGVSQDWCWWKLAQHIKQLTPHDQILIVATHPGRFWFFDDQPQLTNPHIVNIDKKLSPAQLGAVKSYMMYIQRPPLDIQLLSHRLGWLEAQIQLLGLRPAHVLCAFPLVVNTGHSMEEHINWLDYKNVIISKGTLIDNVEIPEMQQGLDEYELWKGVDCRYNHMIKSNHAVLANRVAQAVQNGTNIDLTDSTDFVRGVLHKEIFEDQDFCQKEFDLLTVAERKTYLEKEFQKPWAETSGLFDVFRKKKLK